jgi:hypothetical protein
MDNNPTTETLKIDPTGSDFTPTSYELPAEDKARGEQLLAEFNANPLAAPSPVEASESIKFRAPETLTAAILPPEKRAEVERKLGNVSGSLRAEREDQLVREALIENSKAVRVRAGVGEGASPLQREQFALAGDIDRHEREYLDIQSQLAEVEKWVPVFDDTGKPVIDPDTGQQQVKAIEKIKGDRRGGMEARAQELLYRIGLLNGVEGDRRIQRALAATIEAEKANAQQLAERKEAKQMAEDMAREERVRRNAESIARMKGSKL